MASKKKDKGSDMLMPPLPEKETVFKLISIFSFVLGVVLIYSLFGEGGKIGNELFNLVRDYSGIGAILAPVVLFSFSYYFWKSKTPELSLKNYSLGLVSLLSLLTLSTTLAIDQDKTGGLLGAKTLALVQSFIGHVPGVLVLAIVFILSTASLFKGTSSERVVLYLISKLKQIFTFISVKVDALFTKEIAEKQAAEEDVLASEEVQEEEMPRPKKDRSLRDSLMGTNEESEPPVRNVRKIEKIVPQEIKRDERKQFVPLTEFTPPPISLLEKDKGKASTGDVKQNAAIIKRTLQNFGITVEMDEISIGPSVTRYALKPAQGVKLSRIVGLQNELALDLAVETIRVEAPIPGKSLVGIEIPNESKSTVGLGSLITHDDFQKNPNPLMFALGKGISGKPLFANLAKMPHLLIAGTTGSGKSVTMHAIIQSLLFRNSPYDMKLIMVDPKKVELTFYNNIPHLYTPVITTAKKTIQTLNWAVQEMERRYDLLEKYHEQDIKAYHQKIYVPGMEKVAKGKISEDEAPSKMPYIVIVIDELADIMMTYPKELESAIVRLAQKSRAVGIHLILSTQRPEVKVITGLIKANVPSRIALKVASQIDSRTIIDGAGAEKLLGAGDMLFSSAESAKMERVQSAFISTDEIKRVVSYLKEAYREMVPDEIIISEGAAISVGGGSSSESFSNDSNGDGEDELYEQAKEIVIASGKASTSYLQRRLKVGYSRAARLIDLLEDNGVVGPQDGSKPRTIVGASPEGFGLSDDDDSK